MIMGLHSVLEPKGIVCEKDCGLWYGAEPGNRYCIDSPVEGKGGLDGRIILTTIKANGEHLGLEAPKYFLERHSCPACSRLKCFALLEDLESSYVLVNKITG